MKTDLYTKTLLTIIAVALTIIVFKDISITPTVNAQSHMTANATVMDVNIVSVNGVRLYGGLDVNVKNKVGIDAPYGGLDVNVKNKVSIDAPYGGLNVNVSNYRDFK